MSRMASSVATSKAMMPSAPPSKKATSPLFNLAGSSKLVPGVISVRIILTDGEYTWATQTGLSNDIVCNRANQHNLKVQYATCSYNQLTFNKKSPNMDLTETPTFPSVQPPPLVMEWLISKSIFEYQRGMTRFAIR